MQRVWPLTISLLSEAARGVCVCKSWREGEERGDREAQAGQVRPEEGSVLHKLSANRELTQLRAPSRGAGEVVMTRLSSLNSNGPD